MYEYKIVRYRAKFGNFEDAEQGINDMASKGWRLVNVITKTVDGDSHGFIAFFEREKEY